MSTLNHQREFDALVAGLRMLQVWTKDRGDYPEWIADINAAADLYLKAPNATVIVDFDALIARLTQALDANRPKPLAKLTKKMADELSRICGRATEGSAVLIMDIPKIYKAGESILLAGGAMADAETAVTSAVAVAAESVRSRRGHA